MIQRIIAAGAACIAMAAIAAHAADMAKPEILFDGTSLDAFNQVGDADWTLGGNEVGAKSGKSGYLMTKKSYGDYRLSLEFWTSPDANSGVFLRCETPKEISPVSCYEVNIFDQRPDPTYRTGAIVNVAPPKAKIDAGGHWNTYEIVAKGKRLTITLNGTVTVDAEDGAHAMGPIGFQYGGGTVRFRNITLTPLD
jgi:opacity protein-like surface antigen